VRIINNKFDIIIFSGRPGAGKSEVIDFIDRQPVEKRIKMFGIGEHSTLDDFVDLWIKGEEDDILEELGRPRLYTQKDPTGYSVSDKILYKFLIKKINTAFNKKYSKNTDFFKNKTLFIEFSRGGKDAYQSAFSLLSEEILKRCVVFFTRVSFEESCRKNRKRYNPDAKDSILQHALPDYVMENYRYDDWDSLTSSSPEYIETNGLKIPYYTFSNEPEITNDFTKLEPEVIKGFNMLMRNAVKY